MPRTIEGIVHNHRVHRDLIRQGKNPWPYRVPVAALLDEVKATDRSDAALAKACCNLGALIKLHLPKTWFDITHADYERDLDEIVDRLEDMTADSFKDDASYSLGKHFDGVLDEFYDFADHKRIWTGH